MALQVWLPLLGNLDNQGLAPVQITNVNATIDNNGKLGKCYSFNGTNAKIQIDNLPKPKNVSVALWFKLTAERSGYRKFLFTAWQGITLELATNNTITCSVYSNNQQIGYCRTNYAILVDKWTHIVYTFEEGVGTKLYLNGNFVTSANVTTPISWGTNNFQSNIGWYTNMYFQGCINDFRYYDHTLSAKEVEEISKGLIMHYKFNENSRTSTILYDCSGYGANGTIAGNLISYTPSPRYDSALIFSNNTQIINNIVDTSLNNRLISNFSISTWIWFDNIDLSSSTNQSCYIYNGFMRVHVNINNNKPYLGIGWSHSDGTTSADNNWASIYFQSFEYNQWNHICFTFEDGLLKLYINGVLKNISDRTNNGQYIKGYVGTTINNATYYFKGKLSDMRVYMTTLSEKQIKELYNTSVTIDKNGNAYARELVE